MPHKHKRKSITKQKLLLLACAASIASSMLISCGSSQQPTTLATQALISTTDIQLNQLGFMPGDKKIAIVRVDHGGQFSVHHSSSQKQVLSGTLSAPASWDMAGQTVSVADFSELKQSGEYYLQLADGSRSAVFSISQQVLSAVHDASLKAYYFNRASTALPEQYAGQWARAAGHPDDKVMIHASAASANRPEGSLISAPKGWYDAGDYGKYVVNSGISTYTLLLAYQHFTPFYQQRDGDIPESGDQLPDILNEVKWNLDWLQAMQDPNDGGVYHKLTTLQFTGNVMPADTHEQRYVVQKSTGAALNFAAVLALASDIYAPYEHIYPGLSDQYKQAALNAWRWAMAHPDAVYKQPADVGTGGYGDRHLADEFAFAAAQLFVSTGDVAYLDEFKRLNQPLTVHSWGSTAALGYYALLSQAKPLLDAADYQQFSQQLLKKADTIVAEQQDSAYQVPMLKHDFVWGSNAVAMNKAMLLLIANQVQAKAEYRQAAVALSDYVLGRNPTGYSYVTGFGAKTPMHIHHRPSEADGIVAPVPGFVAGGAQNGWQDKCEYPSKLPAASYVDDFCSYSTNEIAINWNAPLVYVLAGLQAQ